MFPGPGNLTTLISLFGNPKIKNERLTATEAGFRKQFSDSCRSIRRVSLTGITISFRSEPGAPGLEANPPPVHVLIPIVFANMLHGETHGMEIFANVKLASAMDA